MALLKKTPTLEDLKPLKEAYDDLREASKQLKAVNLDIYFLMTMKLRHLDSDQSMSHHRIMDQHRCAVFGDKNLWDSEATYWSQWMERNKHIIDTAELIDQELDRAYASQVKLEILESDLRCCINGLSRPYLRNLTVLDLPDEILLMIFEHVEDGYFDSGRSSKLAYTDYWTPSNDVKVLRLVCKRFCHISSELLLRVVRLNFRQESLTRLEEISRHPIISKGVQAVIVVLDFYNSSFTDIEHFVSFYAKEAERQIEICDQLKMSGISEEGASGMITRGKELAATLRRLLSNERSEEDEHYRSRIGEIHQQYLELLQRQDSLIQSDDFYQAVGSAITRMPCARTLVFDDCHLRLFRSNPRKLMVPGVDMWERLRNCMLDPLSGYDAKTDDLEPPNHQCIIRLIDAIRDKGAFLHHLSIKLNSLGRPMDLVPAPDLRLDFSSGMQQLRTFSFTYESYSIDDMNAGDDDNHDVNDISEFLSACLDTSSLQSLSLDIHGSGEGRFTLPLRQILNQNKSLRKLTHLSLGRLAVYDTELGWFLKRLPKLMFFFYMGCLRLLGGSWRDILDILKEKQPRIILFQDPEGAECENMTEEEYNRTFKKDGWRSRNKAELYISGELHRNPIDVFDEGMLGVEE